MAYSIPKISDELLEERMSRIDYYVRGMIGSDFRVYNTDETNPKFTTWLKHVTDVNPRTEAFNFADKHTDKIVNFELKELKTSRVVIKVGGYYGFLKMTMAEILSQIPEDIVNDVVGFAIKPGTSARVVAGGKYQTVQIVWFGKEKSIVELLRPVNNILESNIVNSIKPAIFYSGKDLYVIQTENVYENFMDYGIWLKINGSHVLKSLPDELYNGKFTFGKEFEVFTPLKEKADVYKPVLINALLRLPQEAINEDLFALSFESVDYYKCHEGIVHRSIYKPVYKVKEEVEVEVEV